MASSFSTMDGSWWSWSQAMVYDSDGVKQWERGLGHFPSLKYRAPGLWQPQCR